MGRTTSPASPPTGPRARLSRRSAEAPCSVEREDGDGSGAYELGVRREGGSQVEVQLDAQFRPVGMAADDDRGSESEHGEESEPESDD